MRQRLMRGNPPARAPGRPGHYGLRARQQGRATWRPFRREADTQAEDQLAAHQAARRAFSLISPSPRVICRSA